jgi:hypothetical protein
MKVRKNREINIVSLSFLDVLANTVGGLVFLLVFSMLLVGGIMVQFSTPRIKTESLPEAIHQREYVAWLAAREGLGKYRWLAGSTGLPPGLDLEPESGRLHGTPRLGPTDGEHRKYEFEVSVTAVVPEKDRGGMPDSERRKLALMVHREPPVQMGPLRIRTGPELPAAFRSNLYSLTFAAEGGQPPYKWSAGQLPEGLQLQQEGTLSGSPVSVGTFSFPITVRGGTTEASKTITMVVSENYPPPPPVPPLRVLTQRIPAAVAGRLYELRLAAEGGSPPYRWSTASGLPAWLKPDPSTSAFAGLPSLLDVGDRIIVWAVSDGGGRSAQSQPIPLTVLPPAGKSVRPLRIRTAFFPEANVGKAYRVALAAEGGFAPYRWTWTGADAQNGLTLSDGVVQGSPVRAGTTRFTVAVTDDSGATATANLSLDVHPALEPLRLVSRATPAARVGQPYAVALSAVGGFLPYRWQLVGGELPAGLRLDQNGDVSGIPKQVGAWTPQFVVRDAEEQTSGAPTTIPIDVLTPAGFHKLVITTQSLPMLLTSREADLALGSEGGSPPYTWQIQGDVPQGLELNGNRIKGIPARSGDFQITALLADGAGQLAKKDLHLTVKRYVPFWMLALTGTALLASVWLTVWLLKYRLRHGRLPLRILTESVPNARASCGYTLQLACIGGAPPYKWRVAEGALPQGLELDESGRLFGKPFEGVAVDVTKDVQFTVEVTDERGENARQRL